jgi:hypothetical protein
MRLLLYRHLDWRPLAGCVGEPGSSQGDGARRVRGWAPRCLPIYSPGGNRPEG